LAQADVILRVVRSYEAEGATSRLEIDAALNELEERVILLQGILAREIAEEGDVG
jgi:hypothetical protein